MAQRRALHVNQMVDGDRLWVGREVGQLMDQTRALCTALTHSNNAATAHIHTGFSNTTQCVQSVFIDSSGDDVCVEFRRCVQVVVVVIQACLFQGLRLRLGQHTQCATSLHLKVFDHFDEFGNFLHISVVQLSPSRTHAKATCAVLFGIKCSGTNLLNAHQFCSLNPCFVVDRLWTITAVLWTTTRLDGQKR